MSRRTLHDDAESVNKYVAARLGKSPKELYAAANHLIASGGKRLRPYMLIKSCQLLGGKRSSAMPAAGAVEMIHNFTLVHDDIMDNDDMRHGVPTVHKKFGMPIAILAGDVLFSKAYHILSESRLPAYSVMRLVNGLAKACVDVCEGQLLDIRMAEGKKIPTQSQYIAMICKKTAALFEVSCMMGAQCATDNPRDISNLASFGRNLGIAFQITDDLMGILGNPKVTKKPVGNDLREGKKSLPILMAINLSQGNDKRTIKKVFGNTRASKADLQNAVDAIQRLDIEQNVRKQALRYARRAEESLAGYFGPAKNELVALLDFVVKRSL